MWISGGGNGLTSLLCYFKSKGASPEKISEPKKSDEEQHSLCLTLGIQVSSLFLLVFYGLLNPHV